MDKKLDDMIKKYTVELKDKHVIVGIIDTPVGKRAFEQIYNVNGILENNKMYISCDAEKEFKELKRIYDVMFDNENKHYHIGHA